LVELVLYELIKCGSPTLNGSHTLVVFI